MTTSPLTALFKPIGSGKISRGTLGYICTRARQRAYDLLVSEFKKSGISQTDLASRLGKAPELIDRWLNRPSNLELDTLSAALFAIDGGVLTFGVSYQARHTVEIFPEIRPSSVVQTKTTPNSYFKTTATAPEEYILDLEAA